MAAVNLASNKASRADSKKLGKRLAEFRKNAGLSQHALAEATGIKLSKIGRIERNKVSPTVNEISKLTLALGIQEIELLYDNFPNFIDISDLWPESRAVINDLLFSLRMRERHINSQWKSYSKSVLYPFFTELKTGEKKGEIISFPCPPWVC